MISNISFRAHEFIVIDAVPESHMQTAKHIHSYIQDYLTEANSAMSCHYFRCEGSSDFYRVMDDIHDKSIKIGSIPFIHMEGHGKQESFIMPDGSCLAWEKVFDKFRAINIATRNNLFVAIGACESAYGYKAAIITRECPVYGLFAPDEIVEAGELEDGFIEFYRGLIVENDVNVAIERFINKAVSSKFSLCLSQMFFEKAARYYLLEHCMGNGRETRLESLTTIAKKKTHLPLKTIRKQLKQKIFKSQASSIQELYNKFMMIDKYPNNAERFNFNIAQFEREVRNQKSGT